MKLTLSWLKQYVHFDWSADQLAERLTMLGIEVEQMQVVSGEFEGVVVAQVLSRDKHPNADKLSLCRVQDGQSERQIVCGAQNFKAGDKVPLILPGHTLPPKTGQPPVTIKVGKIRGVESQGMLCSPQELGLGDGVEGLLILPAEANVGQPFAEHLGRAQGEVIYDLEITPNRPDWNSVIGIAREISALTGNPLKLPEVQAVEQGPPVESLVGVRIEDAELCPRYTARVIQGIKVAPSPDWLKRTLEQVGIRSINNVVDVTNYVMLETGQPLHAFDFHLLQKKPGATPVIVVRRAAEGDKFVTLDGQERTLTAEMLLIADELRAVALAGVMGGQNSEIQTNTVDVLIESACFKPQNVRATSKRLELRTESSYRFERGADIGVSDWASWRAAQLILQTAGGTLAKGVVDAYPKAAVARQIAMRHRRAGMVLGIDIPISQQAEHLRRLGLEVVGEGEEATTFRIPSFRVDLKREIDLIEEVARLHGVDKIPATPPRGAIGSNAFDPVHDQLAEARKLLTGLGLFEAQGQTLIGENAAAMVSGETAVRLANPLSSDMNVLRPSLLPGLLAALRHNVTHNTTSIPLFELGRVFAPDKELRRLGLAITGERGPLFWSGAERGARFDLYDLKGIIEEFLEHFGVRGVTFVRRPASSGLWMESGTIQWGKQAVGEMGQLLPTLARRYDLRDPVMLAELNLDLLLSRRNPAKGFKALPMFPSIRRDVAMVVPEATSHEAVLQIVREVKPANLESAEIFDVFRGQNIATDHKSVAYAFIYRHSQRTLTDIEVNGAHEKLVSALKDRLKASIRE